MTFEPGDDKLRRRASVVIPRLDKTERRFFELVDHGSVARVSQFLADNAGFNVNITDFQGFTALHIAVHNRDTAMVEYLLSSPDIDPGDAHLHAIVINDQKIVALILNKLNKLTKGLEHVGVTQSADFPDNATPLLVAARCGHFEMIEYLLKRHHSISKPHPSNCKCEDCAYGPLSSSFDRTMLEATEYLTSVPATGYPLATIPFTISGVREISFSASTNDPVASPLIFTPGQWLIKVFARVALWGGRTRRTKGVDEINDTVVRPCREERTRFDWLTIEKMRLFTYSAITNPAYICQTVDDPILEAFNISYELKEAANSNKEFHHEYKGLAKSVSEFATELIDCARTIDEVEIILKQSTGFAVSAKFDFPRLLFALHHRQRSFVAHPNVQQLVKSKWIEDWYAWKVMSNWSKLVHILLRIFFLPVILVIVLFLPNSKISKFVQSPVNKFVSSIASYLLFLFVVFLQSHTDKTQQLRGPPNTGIQTILAIYILSYTWAAIRLCLIHGPRRFFSKYWYWFETVMLFLFVLTFLYWITAAIDVNRNGQLELERKYWNMFDPTLIAEGIFCLATIMAYLKLLYFCLLDYHLGPLQLSLGKMIYDVLKFAALYSIILIAFTVGTCKLYQYYDGMVQIDDESKIKTQQVSSFVGLMAALKTFFWAFFCMSPMESADVIIENLPGESKYESVINHHSFTELIGYIAFAVYTFIAVVLILNMLIACMSNTMTRVTENMIEEWAFGRTETYVDFMLTTALPPPFNIIPTPIGIQPIAEYVKILLKPREGKRARWNINHCWFIVSRELHKIYTLLLTRSEFCKSHRYVEFGKRRFAFYFLFNRKPRKRRKTATFLVMSQLVQRYFRKKNREAEQNEAEKMRQDIVELSTMLREALSPEQNFN
ncbi:LOW QUALITY PROTEIN: short transient receptor potential channel 4 [Megalopta genalis]|uniref:LOW QUALITY PROTEIN: short transient receptor potential channel 4 n=1 Tax=Megalopta genalis TaxID=115081 RepID=UPI003FD0C03D